MAIDFPNEPDVNDEFTVDGKIWIYDGVKWSLSIGTTIGLDLGELSDVAITDVSNGQILSYADSSWVNVASAGIATGGSSGQVLAKIDSENYNTEWITPVVYASTGKAIAMAIVFGG